MTSTVTNVTKTLIETISFNDRSMSVGIIAILLLLTLLSQKELIRAANAPRSKMLLSTFNVAIVPLLLVFGFIVLMRFIALF